MASPLHKGEAGGRADEAKSRPQFYVRTFVVLFIFSFFLVSCGEKNAADAGNSPYPDGSVPSDPLAPATTPGTASSSLPGLTYDVTVPVNQRNLIEQDLGTLNSLQISDTTYANILGLTDFSSQALKSWLSERTKYVIGQSYDDNLLAHVAQNNYTYRPVTTANELAAETKIVTLMVNLGAAYYRQGKRDSRIYSLPVSGGYVTVKSPRVGIVQIGEGHFSANRVANSDLSSLANRLLRLSVLFHEARHTDGNGSNVAFPHRTCTSGTYKGSAACEANTNGPYMVELALLYQFYSQCTNCSSTDLATFQAKIADKASRLTDDAAYSDPKPETIP